MCKELGWTPEPVLCVCVRMTEFILSVGELSSHVSATDRVREKKCHLFRGWHGVGTTSDTGDASFQEDRRLISPDLVVFIKTMCFRFFQDYLFLFGIHECFACMYMHRRGLWSPCKLELRMFVSHRVGTGNQTPVPEEAEVLLTTEPLLQPYELPDAIISD